MTGRAKSGYIFIVFFILCVLCTKTTLSYDNSHFYRARLFYGEPRFEKEFLTSLDVSFAGGSTCKALPGGCNDACLLNICGCHHMQYLGKNVPKDLSKETNLILHQLEQIPSKGNFGILSFSGKFKTWELIVNFQQNFKNGFFANVHVPIRRLEIKNIKYEDVSCATDETCSLLPCPQTENANTYWQAFLNMFNRILADHKLSIANTAQQGIGDTSIALGYTINYEDTDFLDFVDGTIRLGILIPTGKKKNENCVFSLPTGYNGHTGVFFAFDTAIGIYDWATLGMHIDAICFNKRCRAMRIKTACEQRGFIKLAKDTVHIKKGTIYNAGIHFKADHFVGGFSLIVGYSYSTKHNDELSCFKNSCIDCTIANTDCALQQWHMHTMHFVGEYDITKEDWKFCPRLNAFYNLVVGGKRIFKTGIGGGGIGLDITWD